MISKRPPTFTLPNIYPMESRDTAGRLYALAIPRLLWSGHPAEALHLLHKVRRYARDVGVADRHVRWTWTVEFEALLDLGRTEEAWRQARRQLRTFWPARSEWPVERRVRVMDHFVHFAEVPAAYFSGRYEYAARALEAHLDGMIERADAYNLLYSIYNGEEVPTHFARVTLWQVYRRLGRRLDSWKRWKRWVERLHPRLLELTRVSAPELAENADRIAVFEKRLRKVEKGLRPAGITYGQRDVLEPRRRVLARQRKHLAWKPAGRRAEFARMLEEKRARYFPWVSTLPTCPPGAAPTVGGKPGAVAGAPCQPRASARCSRVSNRTMVEIEATFIRLPLRRVMVHSEPAHDEEAHIVAREALHERDVPSEGATGS
jgi:hypothetical protein